MIDSLKSILKMQDRLLIVEKSVKKTILKIQDKDKDGGLEILFEDTSLKVLLTTQ